MTKARDIASAIPAPSTVSSAELGYLDGVTSAIQTQVDAKAPSSTAVTLTGTQTLTNKTLTSPVIASVINNTLTSTTGDIIYASGANTPARLGIGSSAQVLTVASGVPSWATPSGGGLVKIGTTTTFSSSSAVNIDNVFSTTYDNYRVIAVFSASPSADLLFRYRVSGSDNSTSNYYLQGQDVSDTVVNNFRLTAEDKGRFGVAAGDETGFAVDIFSPFLSRKKRAQSTSNRGTVILPQIALYWNTFNATTSFTGFTIYPASGTVSGEITVYGYAK